MIFFLKGILIGFIFGVPVGAIGALCIQRSFLYGKKSGIITGFGSSVADCCYASAGAFGVTFISDFLTKYQIFINLTGGLLLLAIGISILRQKNTYDTENKSKISYIKMFISAFVIGITNPAIVITFLFGFSYFGINGRQGFLNSIILIPGIFIGTFLWWIILPFITERIKKKHGIKSFDKLNKIFGFILISFSIILLQK
ncbi:MAG: LysE family transporter [Ruminococcus sp.]|nr:LysE family transporter [Ruminococcus sp.]